MGPIMARVSPDGPSELLEALREEPDECLYVLPNVEMTLLVLGDVEQRAKGFDFPTKEVR